MPFFTATLPGGAPAHWPFLILAIVVAFVVIAISRLRLPAFVALVLAALLAGMLTREFPVSAMDRVPAALRADARQNSWIAAVELTAVEFGNTAGAIAISIGLASIIGICLMESGAADRIVRTFVSFFGPTRAAAALLASTYVLSIPIFFDTLFMLMVPLARALGRNTGRDYALYVMAICVAGLVTHCLCVPHPGPLGMVDNLRVDAGSSLLWGLAAGIPPTLIGFVIARRINRREPALSIATANPSDSGGPADSRCPAFLPALLPVILPIALIGLASVAKSAASQPGIQSLAGGGENAGRIAGALIFLGHKNIALGLGAAVAFAVLIRARRLSFARAGKMMEGPISTAGMIVLITSAGGALGGMLRHAGVGDAIQRLALTFGIPVLLVGWFTAFALRAAQGSATVAMITTSAIVWPMVDPASGNDPLSYNRLYVFLAVAFGSVGGSWMNDSGFWVVSKMGGLTEKQTLKMWSLLLSLVSVSGLLLVLALSRLLPLA